MSKLSEPPEAEGRRIYEAARARGERIPGKIADMPIGSAARYALVLQENGGRGTSFFDPGGTVANRLSRTRRSPSGATSSGWNRKALLPGHW